MTFSFEKLMAISEERISTCIIYSIISSIVVLCMPTLCNIVLYFIIMEYIGYTSLIVSPIIIIIISIIEIVYLKSRIGKCCKQFYVFE